MNSGQAWMDIPTKPCIQTMINQVNNITVTISTHESWSNFWIVLLVTPHLAPGAVFNWVSKVIRKMLLCFSLLRSMIDLKNFCHLHVLNHAVGCKTKIGHLFSMLGACYMYLLQVLIGLFCCLHLSVIDFVLVLWHPVENCSMLQNCPHQRKTKTFQEGKKMELKFLFKLFFQKKMVTYIWNAMFHSKVLSASVRMLTWEPWKWKISDVKESQKFSLNFDRSSITEISAKFRPLPL